MTISVTAVGAANGATGASISIGGVVDIPAGSLIVVTVEELTADTNATGLTDNAGNTYTRAVDKALNSSTTNGAAAIYYCENCNALPLTSTGTMTYTRTTGGTRVSATILYATGTATSSSLDGAVTASAAGSTGTVTVTSGTPSVSGELFIALVANNNQNAITQDTGDGWATPPNLKSNGVGQTLGGNQVNAGTGTLTYHPTIATSNGSWSAMIVGFKPAGGILSLAALASLAMKGNASPKGAVPISASLSMEMYGNSSVPSLRAGMLGSVSMQAKAKLATGTYNAAISAKGGLQLKAKAQPAGNVPLSGASALQLKSRSNPIAAIFIAARSALQMKGVFSGRYAAALAAKSTLQLKTTSQPKGTVSLSGTSVLQLKSRAGAIAAIFLAARSALQLKGAFDGGKYVAAMTAKTALQMKTTTQPTLSLLLRAKTALQMKLKPSVSAAQRAFLVATATLQMKARAATPKLPLALSARTKMAMQGQLGFKQRVLRMWSRIISV